MIYPQTYVIPVAKMAAEFKLELTGKEVKAIPASGEFVFIEVDGKWQVIGTVQ